MAHRSHLAVDREYDIVIRSGCYAKLFLLIAFGMCILVMGGVAWFIWGPWLTNLFCGLFDFRFALRNGLDQLGASVTNQPPPPPPSQGPSWADYQAVTDTLSKTIKLAESMGAKPSGPIQAPSE